MARPLVIPILGNTTDLEAALIRSGVVAEDASKKIQGSFRSAGLAAADEAKKMGASVDAQAAAAGKAAAAFTEMSAKITTAQRNAGKAAATAAGAVGASVDEQRAAYAKAIAVQGEYEAAVGRAASAAKAAAAEQAAAAEAASARVKKAVETQAAAVESAQKKMAGLGKGALVGGAVAVVFSVKGASDLQRTMEQLRTQAGASQAEVNKLTKSVMSMAPGLATGPEALAQSLYHVVSGGVPAAHALQVMAAAAKEAKVSGADLNDTTTALTATVYSGISGAQNYAKAMGMLNATVGAGDMHFQDLNEALGGPMLATVKGYGLSLHDVSAALATMGDLNIRGADAATQLRMAVQYMAKPAATAGPLLEKLGLNTHSFANAMANGGLMPALQLLHDRMDAVGVKGNQMAQVIGALFTKKGASGIDILENSLDKLGTKYTQTGTTANKQNQAWNATTHTLAFQMDQLKATIQTLGDKLGTYLIPKLEAAGNATKDVIAWMGKHKQAAEDLAKVIGGVLGLAITVFAYTKAVQFVKATGEMVTGMSKVVSFMTGGLVPALGRTEAANATAGASFTAVGTEASAAGAEVEAKTAAMAGAVEADDAAIVTANEAAGASFTALLGPIGLAVAALEGYNAIADNPQAAGRQAVDGLQSASGNALSKGQLTSLLASTGAIDSTGKHGLYPWSSDNTALIKAADQALKSFAGSGNQALLDGIIKRAQALKKEWPQDSSALNTLVGLMGKAKQEGAASLPPGVGAQGIPPAIGGWSKGNIPVPATGSNAQRIAGALKAQGFSNVAIAGILGNFAQETGGGNLNDINTKDTGTGASGYGGMGLANWTGSRRTQEIDYANLHHEAPTSLNAQIGYLIQELRGGYHNAFNAIQNAKTPQQAAQLFDQLFEGGTDPGGVRENAAAQAYKMLGSGKGLSSSALDHLLDSTKSSSTATQKPLGIPPRVENMLHLAEQLVGAPYNNQAGHSAAYNETIAQIKKFGTDCSGLVSVLLKEGVTGIKAAQTTQGLPTNAGLSPGTGRYVTVYDRHTGPVGDEHTIIDILGHYFESGGNKQFNPSGGVSELTKQQAAGELHGGGFEAFHPTNLNSPVRGGSTANVPANQTAQLIAQFQAAVTKALTTAADSMLTKLGNAAQSGTLRSLSAALGENTSTMVTTPGVTRTEYGRPVFQNLGSTTRSVASRLSTAIGGLGEHATVGQINRATSGLVSQGSAGSQQEKAFQSEVTSLIANGQKTLAEKLVAAHKAAMQALGQEMYTEQVNKDAEGLALQSQKLTDQTTKITDAAQNQQSVIQAQYQLVNDKATAQVTAIRDMSQIVTDRIAGMVQSVQDSAQTMSDSMSAVASGINDQTQTQVDILGEKGLFGLNLIAQQQKVALDEQKTKDDQAIAVAQLNLDQVTASQHQLETNAQLNLDAVTAAQDQVAALAQQRADTVAVNQAVRLGSAQAKMDANTLHNDVSIVGPAQIAVDLGATLPKAQQDVLNAQLKRAQGQAGVSEGNAAKVFAAVQSSVNQMTAAAQQQATVAQNTANTQIGAAEATLTAVTGAANLAIAAAQGTLTGTQGQAGIVEAGLSGTQAITSAQASTQYAGSGLVVNITGVPLNDASAIASEVGWAMRTNIPA